MSTRQSTEQPRYSRLTELSMCLKSTTSAALRVSAQGFGCMGMTAFYGRPIDDEDAVALLKHAFTCGVTHWDTAEVYQSTMTEDGTTLYNETVVGRGIAAIGKDNRDRLTIATKCGCSSLALAAGV